jgi:hypothetical protein
MSINRKHWIIVFAASFIAYQAQNSFAAPAGHGHHPPNGMGHQHQNGHNPQNGQNFQSSLPAYANSYPYLRAENGVFGPVWAAPGPSFGFGVGGTGIGGGSGGAGYGGYGYGGGWGGGYGLFDYGTNPPYFDFFPPVYYSYSGGAIAPNASLNAPSPGIGTPVSQEVAAPAPAGQASQPLIIVNPYYKSGK